MDPKKSEVRELNDGPSTLPWDLAPVHLQEVSVVVLGLRYK